MNAILNNPYRTVGLLAGATAREQDRQIRRLKQYIASEQEPEKDYSFPVLGMLPRTLADVENAESKLNLSSDKMEAALFWFWNGNPITDEVAFDALQDGDVESAYRIWDKLTVETKEDGKRFWKTVTEKNHSAFHNLAVLQLVRTKGNLSEAIMGGLYFLESDLVWNFVSAITDETYKINKKELQLLFLERIYVACGEVKPDFFLNVVNRLDFSAKRDFLNGMATKHIGHIERHIELAKNTRRANAGNGIKAGTGLVTSTAGDLKQIKSIVGTDDLKYASIADKVAEEILQCSIDYYNKNYESAYPDSGYIETASILVKKAREIVQGNMLKERIRDNLNTIEKAKDRELLQAIEVLEQIKRAYFQAYSMHWNGVVEVIQTAIPRQHIEKIKNASNASALREFKSLVEFLFDKMPSYESDNKRKIAYLCYWKTVIEKINVPIRTWWLIISGIIFLFLFLADPSIIFNAFTEHGVLGLIMLFPTLLISGFLGFLLLVLLEKIYDLMGWIKRKMSG